MVMEPAHDIVNPCDKTLNESRIALPNIPQKRNTALHIGQSIRNHLLDHIRVTHVRRADLIAVCVQLLLCEPLCTANFPHEVTVNVGIVRLHPVHCLMPERPLWRDLAVHIEEGYTILMESMQGRVTLEEHHGHTHLTPPVHENMLTRADTSRRDEADTVQHFL